jgi:hypothetical protein
MKDAMPMIADCMRNQNPALHLPGGSTESIVWQSDQRFHAEFTPAGIAWVCVKEPCYGYGVPE